MLTMRAAGLGRTLARVSLLAATISAGGPPVFGAQRAFFVFPSPASETVRGTVATNFVVTLTYSNASGTINNAVFTNGVSVLPPGQGVAASLNATTSPIGAGGGTGTLPLTIAAAASAPAGTYQIVVGSTNLSFTANSPVPGVFSLTNLFTVGGPGNSNAFSLALSPAAASVPAGVATNLSATVTLVDYSSTLAGWVTNGVTVSGPDATNVMASLDTPYAELAGDFGQTAFTLTINVNANATPGTYAVAVVGTNHAFTANPTPGLAAATYTLTVLSNTVTKPMVPVIDRVVLSGATLTVTGTQGVPGWPYRLLSSTNVALPLDQWLALGTNACDSIGGFRLDLALTDAPSSAASFLALAFFIPPAVATPVFSPPAGAFGSTQAVTITTATADADLRYTTDGSEPSETHGTLYTGPVTIAGPVITNLSGMISNASGATLLKAVACRSGLADSAVFSGIYEIMQPAPDPSPSPLRGVAHVAYHVTNLAAARHFWEDYLGFAEPFTVASNIAVIKINDHQYVELYEGALDPAQFQLVNFGYEVADAEAMRRQLASQGVSVPAGVSTNALGNLSFLSIDPDGHTLEWVQYRTNSLTGRSLGQALPGSQVFGYIVSIGGFTTNETAADDFYLGQCGFDTNQTHLVHIPNSNSFYENGMVPPGTVTAAVAGKKDQIDLLNFRGLTIQQSVAILQQRDPAVPIDLSLNGTPGTKQRWVANIYDPDGSRVELDDQ